MIYLDSSALLKLLVEEDESDAFVAWLLDRVDTPVVSSELAKLEVVRAARRLSPEAVPAARALVSSLDLIPVTGRVIDEAADVGEPTLRSLDAIHLASALTLGPDLIAFVTYDKRLLVAAQASGVAVDRPGAVGGD